MSTRTADHVSLITQMLQDADIRTDGERPWDMHVHDERVYDRIVAEGSLGLGEAYMNGWWDCDSLDEFFFRLLRSGVQERAPHSIRMMGAYLRFRFLNPQTQRRALAVAERHYNLGNDFYEAMLDPYMQYSCGYFRDTDNLAAAQEAKLDLICRKLDLQPGDHLLDIGCGWGGLARFAAERYGCRVTGINISTEQIAYARERCAGLPVEILERDYRVMEGQFDKIVSVGMFEHVGPKNYRSYMETAHRCLKPDGVFLLHSIGSSVPVRTPDRWIERYIFPNSVLPGAAQAMEAAENLFVMEDWHNFGASYDRTLMAWHRNWSESWHRFEPRYGDRFARMWRYYLLSCAGSFRARYIQLWQIVLSPRGLVGGYRSAR